MKASAILSIFLSPIGHTPSETCRQVPAFSSSTLTTVPDSARQAALDPSRQTIARMPLSSRTISQPKENLRIIDLPIHKGIGVMRARGHSFPGGRCMSRNHEAIVLDGFANHHAHIRSEEHTSELQSLMRISYAVFCLKK